MSTTGSQPPPIPYATPALQGALSVEQIREIEAARVTWRKIGRAIAIAKFDGWSTGIFAVLTLLGGFWSVWGIVLAMTMAVVSYQGFRGARRLKALDGSALKLLAMNQLMFGLLLLGYAVAMLILSLRHPESMLSSLAGADPEVVGMVAPMLKMVYTAVYAAMAAVAVIGPGLMAVYYRSRQKYVQAYLHSTPGWIRDLQQAGMQL